MNKYRNSKIYKIVNSHNDEIYVGSTCNELRWRWAAHKQDGQKQINGTRETNYELYNAFSELGVENFRIILVENWPCNSKDELRMREDHWIQILKPAYNMRRAYRTVDQLKDYRKQYYKNYNETRKDTFKCDICEQSYANKGNLNKHFQSKKHHLELEEYNFDIEMDRLGCDITLFD